MVRDKVYGNIGCTASQYSQIVQRFCPVTCGIAAASSGSSSNSASLQPEPPELGQSQVAPPCEVFTIRDRDSYTDGLFRQVASHQQLGGQPIYLSHDQNTIMYYKTSCRGWTFIGKSQWNLVLQGVSLQSTCYSTEELGGAGMCGKHDTSMVGPYGVGCDVVRQHVYSNLHCGVDVAQRFCPHSCASQISYVELTVPLVPDPQDFGSRFVSLGFSVACVSLIVCATLARVSRPPRGSDGDSNREVSRAFHHEEGGGDDWII